MGIGQKLIRTKLMFKKKNEIDESVRLKYRDVSMVFMIFLCVDFTERLSPVATDDALKTQNFINLKKCKQRWRAHSCDIEVAFLEPTTRNETHVYLCPPIVECGFIAEVQ